MNFGIYVILAAFGLFIILLIRYPNFSCFGKRIKSPFYPILRRRRYTKGKTGYGSRLTDKTSNWKTEGTDMNEEKKVEDYGFRLDD
jgi:hypothetical protein